MKKLLRTLMWGSVALGAVLLALGMAISIFPLILVGIVLIVVPIGIVLLPHMFDMFNN